MPSPATKAAEQYYNLAAPTLVRIPYHPRWFQDQIHRELRRFNVLVLHRRAGKTVFAINECIFKATTCEKPNARVHYMAPNYRQAKRIAWSYVKEYTAPIPGMQYNESELRAIFPNGAELLLLGSQDYHSLRGIYSDFVVLDEFANMHPAVWGEIFRPALMDRKGGAIFMGTPQGRNQFYDKWEQAGEFDDWYRAIFRVNETGALAKDEIIQAAREMSKEEFEQEMLCSWDAAIRGAFYAKQMQQLEADERIMSVPHDPAIPVVTSWDLGMRDYTVVTHWQIAGREHRMIDVDTFEGMGLEAIVKVLKDKPYNYGKHILPHDVNVRELGTGKSRLEVLRKLGLKCDIAPNVALADGIQSVRTGLPTCVIDRRKCKIAIDALKQYRTEYDERLQVFKPNPLHDWTSHYSDSVRYFFVTENRSRSELWGKQRDFSDYDKSVI